LIPTPSPVRRARRLSSGSRLAAVLVPAGVLAAGCDVRDAYEQAFAIGFPEPITPQGQRIYDLWLGSAAASLAVGVFVWLLILWSGFRYRKKSDQLPRQVRYNLPIEVLYTVVPFVVIAVLFYYTVLGQNYVNQLTPDDEGGPDVTIGVVGFQWNWTFNYEDDQVSVTGSPTEPPVLVLPTDRTIRFEETSPDVIHSFWVPKFLFKRDVIPGRENTFEITLTKEGEYRGHCAEFCGEKHASMDFYVRVVSPQEYDAYIDELKQNPDNQMGSGLNTGAVDTEALSGSDS
jgi:cytochrome c oxidase subunit 2